MSSTRGRFIVLEGGEASGKSTQAALLAQSMDAVLTREPGGTAAGEHMRALLLDPALPAVTARAEALLMLAARAQHVEEVIAPALASGRHVVCDRFSGSTIAYQGHGRGLDPVALATMSAWASEGLEPERVILLSVDAGEAARRRVARRGTAPPGRHLGPPGGHIGPDDRIESEETAFHARIDAGFASLAAADPDRWRVVDGSGSVEEVAARVAAAARP